MLTFFGWLYKVFAVTIIFFICVLTRGTLYKPGKSLTAFSGKEIYNNPKTGKQVVYDTDGNYFRIEDTTLTGKRVYTDINGNQIPNNKFVNGKQIGISKSEYNQLTHFNNID